MKQTLKNIVMALGAIAMITACGGGSNGGATDTTTTDTQTTETPTASTGTTTLAFTNIENAELDTSYTSNTVTVAGVDGVAKVKTDKGSVVVNGVDTGVKEYDVRNGDTVAIRVRSSGSYSSGVTVRVELQGKVDFFGVTTKGDTASPAPSPSPSPAPNTAPNTAPTANALTVNAAGARTVSGTIVISDAEDAVSVLTVVVVTAPVHGAIAWNTKTNFTYTVTAGSFYNGNDSFTYYVQDSQGLQSATKTVTVLAVLDL